MDGQFGSVKVGFLLNTGHIFKLLYKYSPHLEDIFFLFRKTVVLCKGADTITKI